MLASPSQKEHSSIPTRRLHLGEGTIPPSASGFPFKQRGAISKQYTTLTSHNDKVDKESKDKACEWVMGFTRKVNKPEEQPTKTPQPKPCYADVAKAASKEEISSKKPAAPQTTKKDNQGVSQQTSSYRPSPAHPPCNFKGQDQRRPRTSLRDPDRPWHWVVVNGIPIKMRTSKKTTSTCASKKSLQPGTRSYKPTDLHISLIAPGTLFITRTPEIGTACSGKTVQLYITPPSYIRPSNSGCI
ncbi:hypothetical protein BKA70DRAFT_1488587 [Coprinopsis sp. MPI-PUGE-AT-0042]|nr:hypothetical protein BKA70DRAFT_1488587 [Coprinopsis sp. MPI-PUGE-AT-0042]